MKQKSPQEHECDHILIVEGHSDLLFYAAVLHHLGRLNGVFIKAFHGKSKILHRDLLADYLNAKLLAEKKTIGILIDADDTADGTIQALSQRLDEITGLKLTEGTWCEQEASARIGFFVAPDGQSPGEIETLAWSALEEGANIVAMKQAVDDYLGKMRQLGWPAHSPDKGRIGVYLAAAYDEDPRLGPGAREGKFDFSAPGFARLRSFLEVLPQGD